MFTVNGFKVKFGHYNPSNPKKHKRVTLCDIYDEENNLVASEEAFCSKNDPFNKEQGRKIALARALRILYPNDPSARAQFWDAYFIKRNKKNTKDIHPVRFTYKDIGTLKDILNGAYEADYHADEAQDIYNKITQFEES